MKRIKPTCYLAGKITGLPYQIVWLKFKFYTLFLRMCGFKVYNPIDHVSRGTSWGMAMDICLKELEKCHFIYMQPDWRWSRGARIEFFAASRNGLGLANVSRGIKKEFLKHRVYRTKYKQYISAV